MKSCLIHEIEPPWRPPMNRLISIKHAIAFVMYLIFKISTLWNFLPELSSVLSRVVEKFQNVFWNFSKFINFDQNRTTTNLCQVSEFLVLWCLSMNGMFYAIWSWRKKGQVLRPGNTFKKSCQPQTLRLTVRNWASTISTLVEDPGLVEKPCLSYQSRSTRVNETTAEAIWRVAGKGRAPIECATAAYRQCLCGDTGAGFLFHGCGIVDLK